MSGALPERASIAHSYRTPDFDPFGSAAAPALGGALGHVPARENASPFDCEARPAGKSPVRALCAVCGMLHVPGGACP